MRPGVPSGRPRLLARPACLALGGTDAYNGVASARPLAPAPRGSAPMPLFAIPFPAIDPVAVAVGPSRSAGTRSPISSGLLLGWRYCLALAARPPHLVRRQRHRRFPGVGDAGRRAGGRLGYVLFYNSAYYFAAPDRSALPLARRDVVSRRRDRRDAGDRLFAAGARRPVSGVRRHHLRGRADRAIFRADRQFHQRRAVRAGNGRALGNGIPGGGPLPRHPSQLYEAACEGLLLFLVLFIAERSVVRRHPGMLSGLFLAGYAVARMSGELFRNPTRSSAS